MKDIATLFGSMVFHDDVMRALMPAKTYAALERAVSDGADLHVEAANEIARVMKDWAVEKGATHYTHWFQPMTGTTAEKHESFIANAGKGKAITEFRGSELVRGESDASSFPSGGLRATFEARGYTVWDYNSYAFIKDGSLCIPTAFCSYSGEALDKKTPLLRSMDTLDREALRILRLFGNNDVCRVIPTVGTEQEYFLIDKEMFLKRPDLIYSGRTLFGARPPKGQELEDHYYGCIKPRISAFMKELDEELWKLGVYAKTKHNETAPAQYELAVIYTSANVATDHNQLTMELLKSIANKHGLACLLHEKPFRGVNGSGKHINWSLATDAGVNLLESGRTPRDNAQFLLFLVAVIKAADEYQEMLRVSAASAGNDERLGAHEAPPAIVSLYLGEELSRILDAVENGEDCSLSENPRLEIGATMLPRLGRDSTDRNRTSPLAFTGNKFEFRMSGSAFSAAGPAIVLNTIVADALRGFADSLEGSLDFTNDLSLLIKKTYREHKRIIFNGNAYSQEWENEARRRGLSQLSNTVDALAAFTDPRNVALFGRHRVFSAVEITSRSEILLDSYCKSIHIEALAMLDMLKSAIIPACVEYQNLIAALLEKKKALGGFEGTLENYLLTQLCSLCDSLPGRITVLEEALADTFPADDIRRLSLIYRDRVCTAMAALRADVDELEKLIPRAHWPFPVYSQMLYSVI